MCRMQAKGASVPHAAFSGCWRCDRLCLVSKEQPHVLQTGNPVNTSGFVSVQAILIWRTPSRPLASSLLTHSRTTKYCHPSQ